MFIAELVSVWYEKEYSNKKSWPKRSARLDFKSEINKNSLVVSVYPTQQLQPYKISVKIIKNKHLKQNKTKNVKLLIPHGVPEPKKAPALGSAICM